MTDLPDTILESDWAVEVSPKSDFALLASITGWPITYIKAKLLSSIMAGHSHTCMYPCPVTGVGIQDKGYLESDHAIYTIQQLEKLME